MERERKILFWLVGLLLAGLAIMGPVQAGETDGITPKNVKIGVLTALTGPAALYGKECAEAVQLYFKMINDKGGLNGRLVQVIPVDGAWSPATSVGAMKTLLYQDKVFVANTFGTEAATATYSMIEQENLPTQVIGPGSTLYNPPKKQLFCVQSSYKTETMVGLKYVMESLKTKDPKFGILYIDDAAGRDSLDGLEATIKAYGLKVTGQQSYSRGATDFSSQIINLKNAGANYVILWALTGETAQVLRQAKTLGFNAQFIGLSPSTNDKLIELAGDAAEGFFTASHTALPNEDVPGMKLIKDMADKYNMKVGITPYYFHSWVMANVWDAVIRKAEAKGNLTRNGVIEALENIKNMDVGGLVPPLTFSPTRRQSGTMARITKVDMKSKRFVPATGWIEAVF
jgi:branched-chain amino acid transport system substrate-binding protein